VWQRVRVEDGQIKAEGLQGMLPGQVITLSIEDAELVEDCLQQLQMDALEASLSMGVRHDDSSLPD